MSFNLHNYKLSIFDSLMISLIIIDVYINYFNSTFILLIEILSICMKFISYFFLFMLVLTFISSLVYTPSFCKKYIATGPVLFYPINLVSGCG